MNNNQNINKIIVNFFLSIFIFVTIFIVLLLVLYYFTPNNYTITKLNISDYIFDKEIKLNVQPNSKVKLNYSDYLEYYFKFDLETNLLIQNSFKSQNIICMSDELVKIKYQSDVFITNSTEKEINLQITFYLQKK